MPITIRPTEKKDNPILADLIKSVFREFKIDKPGTVYTDPTTNNLYQLFTTPRSAYWIAEEEGEILGGCGIFPTQGLPTNCAELVKFYLSSTSRGKGIGKTLIEMCINSAINFGYKQLYLESFPELSKAVGMYKKSGFIHIDQPMGNSGHFACKIWMVKNF